MPPHDLGAEQAVLGSMLLEGDAIARVVEILRREDFYGEAHQRIFETVAGLFERGEPVDLITVTDRLRMLGYLEDAGGAAYVTSLLDATPTAANVRYYMHIVLRDSVKRSLIGLSAEVGHAVRDGRDPEELVALGERMIGDLKGRLEFDSFTYRERARTDRISGADLAQDTEPNDVAWLPFLRLKGVVGRGLAMLVSGHGKVGKTTLLLHAVRGLLPAKLIWITEEPRSLWRERVRRFPELASNDLVLIFAGGRLWADVLADLEREDADLLIIDTIRGVCGITDENDQAVVTSAIQPLVFLGRRKNWALILVHHLRKSAADVGLGHAGSHALVGLVDVAVELHRDSHSPRRRTCKAVSRFDQTPPEWILELREDGLEVLGDPAVIRAADLIERVAAVLEDVPHTRDQIADRLDPPPSRGALHAALNHLARSERAVRTGTGKRGDPHRWAQQKSFIHEPSSIRERMESVEGT